MRNFLITLLSFIVVGMTIGCTENVAGPEDDNSIQPNGVVAIVYNGHYHPSGVGDSTYVGIVNAISAVDGRSDSVKTADPLVRIEWSVSRTGLLDTVVLNTTNIALGLQGINYAFPLKDTLTQTVTMTGITKNSNLLYAYLNLKVKGGSGLVYGPVVIDSFGVDNKVYCRYSEVFLENSSGPYAYQGDMTSWVTTSMITNHRTYGTMVYQLHNLLVAEGENCWGVLYQVNPALWSNSTQTALNHPTKNVLCVVRRGDSLFTYGGVFICKRGQSIIIDSSKVFVPIDSVSRRRISGDTLIYQFRPTAGDSLTLLFNYTGVSGNYAMTEKRQPVAKTGANQGYATYVFMISLMENLFYRGEPIKILKIQDKVGGDEIIRTSLYNAIKGRAELAVKKAE